MQQNLHTVQGLLLCGRIKVRVFREKFVISFIFEGFSVVRGEQALH